VKSGKGWGAWLTSLVKSDNIGDAPHKAFMGGENAFYFDPVANKWVNRNATEPAKEEAPFAHPPQSNSNGTIRSFQLI